MRLDISHIRLGNVRRKGPQRSCSRDARRLGHSWALPSISSSVSHQKRRSLLASNNLFPLLYTKLAKPTSTTEADNIRVHVYSCCVLMEANSFGGVGCLKCIRGYTLFSAFKTQDSIDLTLQQEQYERPEQAYRANESNFLVLKTPRQPQSRS